MTVGKHNVRECINALHRIGFAVGNDGVYPQTVLEFGPIRREHVEAERRVILNRRESLEFEICIHVKMRPIP
jgi:hypothetical protein